MPVSANVFGTCVSRDIFGLFPNNGGFIVPKCVMNSCYVSACSPPISDTDLCTPDSFPNTKNNFVRRCASLDINKKVFDYLSEAESDYLITDLGTLHCALYKIDSPKGITYITKTKGIYENPSALAGSDIDVLEILEFSPKNTDTYREYIPQLAESLKKLIPEDRIIIIETKFSETLINSKGDILPMTSDYSFSEIDLSAENLKSLNSLLTVLYEDLRQKLPKAHFIPMPSDKVPANPRHRWGFDPMHYVFEAYEYFLECVKVITSETPNENSEILRLAQDCSEKINSRYYGEKYNLKNLSKPVKKESAIGEPIPLILDSESNFGKCRYTIQYKHISEKDWKLERTSESIYNIFPEKVGEHNLCIKAIDKNNLIAKKYFRLIIRNS